MCEGEGQHATYLLVTMYLYPTFRNKMQRFILILSRFLCVLSEIHSNFITEYSEVGSSEQARTFVSILSSTVYLFCDRCFFLFLSFCLFEIFFPSIEILIFRFPLQN